MNTRASLSVFMPSLLVAFTLSAQAAPAPRAEFSSLAEQFIHQTLMLSPVTASAAGYHTAVDPHTGAAIDLDAQLDDYSSAAIARQRRVYVEWRERFRTLTPPASLSPEDAADWHLIDDQISLTLLDLDRIQSWRHRPTVYVELVGDALFEPLTNNYAPIERRLDSILSRVALIPRLLDQARLQLRDSDPIFIKVAIDENAGNIDMIQNSVAAAIPQGSPLLDRYNRVAPKAIAALKSFSDWLQTDLARRKTTRTWRLGTTLYAAKFSLVMGTPVTPAQVLAQAQTAFAETRKEMFELALPLHTQYFPGHSDHANLAPEERANTVIREVLGKIAEDHPRAEDLSATVKADLVGIRRFILDKRIVSLGERDNLKVIDTPLFMRGIFSVAGFHSAPPLDPNSEAQYWVTPIDPAAPAASTESRLREYNNWVLQWLSIHEALPGHYVQAEHANDIQPPTRRLIRAFYGNGAYVEGWAEYIAQVMMREGYANSDPRYQLSYLKIWLRAIANAILDIRMQTMNMTDQQALAFMMDSAFQTRAEAEGKLQRAKLSSTQLPTYFVGTNQWWALRRAYQAARGSSFTLAEFHDRALAEGALPVPWLKGLIPPTSNQ